MKKIFGIFILISVVFTGCAKDNLQPLHLVSTEEISQKRREAEMTALAQNPEPQEQAPAAPTAPAAPAV